MFHEYQSSIINDFMDIHLDILEFLWISLDFYGYPWISMDILGFLWISLGFYGYPCIDLLWILDPGLPCFDYLNRFSSCSGNCRNGEWWCSCLLGIERKLVILSQRNKSSRFHSPERRIAIRVMQECRISRLQGEKLLFGMPFSPLRTFVGQRFALMTTRKLCEIQTRLIFCDSVHSADVIRKLFFTL